MSSTSQVVLVEMGVKSWFVWRRYPDGRTLIRLYENVAEDRGMSMASAVNKMREVGIGEIHVFCPGWSWWRDDEVRFCVPVFANQQAHE